MEATIEVSGLRKRFGPAVALEGTADHLVIIGRGRVLADTPTRDLVAAASGDRVTLRTTAPDRAGAAGAGRVMPGRRHASNCGAGVAAVRPCAARGPRTGRPFLAGLSGREWRAGGGVLPRS